MDNSLSINLLCPIKHRASQKSYFNSWNANTKFCSFFDNINRNFNLSLKNIFYSFTFVIISNFKWLSSIFCSCPMGPILWIWTPCFESNVNEYSLGLYISHKLQVSKSKLFLVRIWILDIQIPDLQGSEIQMPGTIS